MAHNKCGVYNIKTGEHQEYPFGYTFIKGRPFGFLWRFKLAIIRAWQRAGKILKL